MSEVLRLPQTVIRGKCGWCGGDVDLSVNTRIGTNEAGHVGAESVYHGRCSSCSLRADGRTFHMVTELVLEDALEIHFQKPVSVEIPIIQSIACPACDGELEAEIWLEGEHVLSSWPHLVLSAGFRCRDCGYEDGFGSADYEEDIFWDAAGTMEERYKRQAKPAEAAADGEQVEE